MHVELTKFSNVANKTDRCPKKSIPVFNDTGHFLGMEEHWQFSCWVNTDICRLDSFILDGDSDCGDGDFTDEGSTIRKQCCTLLL